MTEPEAEAGRERGSEFPRSPRSPGATLLTERRSQGLSLGDVARQLKLSVRQVEALERDEYSGFSGSVFVRGFLRNYAKLLHLDPDRVLEAAGESIAPARVVAPVTPDAPPPTARNEEGRRRVLTWSAFGVLAVVVLFLLASNASKEQHETAVTSARPTAPAPIEAPTIQSQVPSTSASAEPVSVAAQSASVAASTPSPVETDHGAAPSGSEPTVTPRVTDDAVQSNATPAQEASPEKPRLFVSGSGAGQIRMVFEDEAWVEIKDGSGDTIFSRLNAPGTERLIRGQPPFAVVVGNAHAVKLHYRGKSIDLGPHTRVDVARVTLE